MLDASVVRTRKLYDEDAYRSEFEGRVLSARLVRRTKGGYREVGTCMEGTSAEAGSRSGIDPAATLVDAASAAALSMDDISATDAEELRIDVVLDASCFFPEEGGQSPDEGYLASYVVKDVQIHEEEIHHYLALPDTGASLKLLLEAGNQKGLYLHGRIDWETRFSNMQQHSGEHLLSGIVKSRYGFDNVGFHLSASEVTVDYNGVIPAEELPELEREVNQVIWRNIPSEVKVTAKEEREHLEYRSKLNLEGEVRIVTYPGVDSCACCAPHVRHTGEIGFLKILSMISWKGGVRLQILCGDRALSYVQSIHGIVTRTANFLTTSRDNVLPQVTRMKEEIRELKTALGAAAEKELLRAVEELPEGTENAVLFAEEADSGTVRKTVNRMMENHPGYCAVFTGGGSGPYSFVIGSRTRDCREIVKRLKELYGARGGGKADLVQGSVSAPEAELRAQSLFPALSRADS